MFETTVVLAVTKSVTLVAGALLTTLSWRAYRRTRAPALRALATGIGLVTAGAIAGGLVHQFTAVPLAVAVSVQSVFTATGFVVLAYSLYARGVSETRSRDPADAVGGS